MNADYDFELKFDWKTVKLTSVNYILEDYGSFLCNLLLQTLITDCLKSIMEKRKRKELSLKEKVNLINFSSGKSQRQLAEQFGIGKTQVQTILKRKAEYLEGYENNAANERKRLCKRSPVEEVNIVVWEWYQKMQQSSVRIIGPMLQEKALIYAKDLGISESDFKASKGWLSRFRDRHNLSFVTISGESGCVSEKTVEEWKSKLPDLTRGYAPQDIYNMDETGLYYRALPDKSLCVRGQEFKGGKKFKERLTAMLCVNMTGDFEKPLVIGKAEKPRCFKHVDVKQLPVTWKWNRKAWMTSEIFKEWLKSFNNKMRCQQRNVLLFLDNATSHPDHLSFSNVKVMFLPKNTTSVLQPLDQGIIQNMKTHYRKRLIRSVLAKIEEGETVNADEVSKSVNVLQAIRFITSAVKDVKSTTVTNCFRKAGFCTEDESDEFEDDDVPLQELADLLRTARDKIQTEEEMTVQEFMNIDIDLPVHEELDSDWEDNLVQTVRDRVVTEDSSSVDIEREDAHDSHCELTLKSHKDALLSLEQLRMYCFSKNLSEVLQSLDFVQESIEKDSVKILSCSKQTTITKFFK